MMLSFLGIRPGFISPMFWLRTTHRCTSATPGKFPEFYKQKAAKDESLAAAEVQSAFAVPPALLTAQMIKHFRLYLQQLFFSNHFYNDFPYFTLSFVST
jgi:hypothetical protein